MEVIIDMAIEHPEIKYWLKDFIKEKISDSKGLL